MNNRVRIVCGTVVAFGFLTPANALASTSFSIDQTSPDYFHFYGSGFDASVGDVLVFVQDVDENPLFADGYSADSSGNVSGWQLMYGYCDAYVWGYACQDSESGYGSCTAKVLTYVHCPP